MAYLFGFLWGIFGSGGGTPFTPSDPDPVGPANGSMTYEGGLLTYEGGLLTYVG